MTHAPIPPPPAPRPRLDAWAPPTGPPVAASRSRAPRARRRARAASVLATVALAVASGAAGGLLTTRGPAATDAAEDAPTMAVVHDLDGGDATVTELVAAVSPSVVSITATVETRRGPFVREGEGAGTGVVLDDAGHVLTNAHVVEGATAVTVTLSGEERERAATVVGSDAAADIAVLRVAEPDGLVAATFGDSDTLVVGETVVAIGNALALEGGMTVTRGIVSALDRSIETESGSLTGLVQTDAAISSGNSGGPLVDAAGEVVGVNTAVATSGGGSSASNIGFVIAIDDALAVADQLLGVGA